MLDYCTFFLSSVFYMNVKNFSYKRSHKIFEFCVFELLHWTLWFQGAPTFLEWLSWSFFMMEWYSRCVNPTFIYPSSWHVDLHQEWAVMSCAAINMGVRVTLQHDAFNSLGKTPRRRTAVSAGITRFSFRRNLYTDSHTGYWDLPSQQGRRAPLSPDPHQHLLLFDFSVAAFSLGSDGISVLI